MPGPDANHALRLTPASCEAISRLIEEHGSTLATGWQPPPSALHTTALRVCEEVRASAPDRAELLVMALREAWWMMPSVRRLTDHEARLALYDVVVSECIRCFYDAPKREYGH